jgi:FkbM family methyltransferase
MLILEKAIRSIKSHLFPSKFEKEVNRYIKDGGDDKYRYNFDLNTESLVLDFGGYKGQWASDIYSKYNCKIYIFEPLKMYFDKISERFEKNPKIETFCLALGEFRRTEQIGICDDGTSVFRDTQEKSIIQFEDVAVFFDEFNIGEIDLLKMNIEGGEYELLKRLIETGLIKKIKQIQIQFHNIESDSEKKMRDICGNLAKTHTASFQYKFVWENWVRNN